MHIPLSRSATIEKIGFRLPDDTLAIDITIATEGTILQELAEYMSVDENTAKRLWTPDGQPMPGVVCKLPQTEAPHLVEIRKQPGLASRIRKIEVHPQPDRKISVSMVVTVPDPSEDFWHAAIDTYSSGVGSVKVQSEQAGLWEGAQEGDPTNVASFPG